MKGLFGWKSLVIAVILLLVFVGQFVNLRINHKSYYDPFMDYDFRFNFGPGGEIELDTSKFRLSSTLRTYTATGFLLPHWARQRVFDMMHEMDIMNYPESLDNISVGSKKVETYTLAVRIENQEKIIKWKVPLELKKEDLEKMTEKQIAFFELAEQIKAFVYNSNAFKLLTYGDMSFPRHMYYTGDSYD